MTAITLVKGNSYTCFNSQDIKWVSCYKLLVDMVETPVDYCNSGFTLHNDKLYVESFGDILQFAHSVDSNESKMYHLIEDKEMPPEVMYLLSDMELQRHCRYQHEQTYPDSEKGTTWDIEYEEYEVQYDNEPKPTKEYNSSTVILDEARHDFLWQQFRLKKAQLVGEVAYWKELCDNSWFEAEEADDSPLEIEEYDDSEY
jgi:hypothetical protein